MGEQSGLFDAEQPDDRSAAGSGPDPGRRADAPLASRLRPRSFDELVGQDEVVTTLRGLAESGRLPSLVL